MKLAIVGSRDIKYIFIAEYLPTDVTEIVSGGAKGVDTLAENYADKHKISKLILRPQYNKYKKGAPLKRNEKMIELADRVLVIYDGKSNGTKYTIDYAKKLNKQVNVIAKI